MKRIGTDEIKKIEIDILIAFDNLCRDNSLYYTLAGGTLLGAIRHKGFIPWDDDIDVLMPRTSYDRLLKNINLNKEKFPEYLKIVSWKEGGLEYPFIKVINTKTKIDQQYVNNSDTSCLWIDIFPIDGNPENDMELKKVYDKSLFLRKLLKIKISRLGEGKSFLKKIGKPFLKCMLFPISLGWICDRIDSISREYSFEDSKYIGGIVWGYGPQERIDKAKYMRSVKVEFEGHEFYAPSNFNQYLRGLYGDYMKLPPEEKRFTHDMVAYIEDDTADC